MARARCMVVSLVMLLVTGVHGEICITPADVDVLDLAENGIFRTESAEVDGTPVSEEIVNERMEAELATNAALRDIVEAVANEQSNNPNDPASSALESRSQTGDAAVDAKISLTLTAFFHTCPHRSWWLLRGSWYFFSRASDGTRFYYWTFYHWWYVSCGQKYCDLSFRVPWFWHHYHRCFPEYRRIWFWTMCLRIDPNGNATWNSRLIFRYVPRGCCCRKYWKALTFLQCPAHQGEGHDFVDG